MKRAREFVGACTLIAVIVAGCGGPSPQASDDTPSAAEKIASELSAAQVWTSPSSSIPGGPFTTASYSCSGSTFYWRQPIEQSAVPFTSLRRTVFTNEFPISIDSSRNEVQLLCGAMFMVDKGTNLANAAANTCDVISHLAGQSSWSYSVKGASMLTATTYYWPIGFAGLPAGAWQVYLVFPRADGATLSQWYTGYGTSCFAYPGPGQGSTQQYIY